jgi:hypothetical protein
MSDDADRTFQEAFERLRLRHLAFRRAEPDEIREIEAMRLDVLRAEGALDLAKEAEGRHFSHLRLRLMERAYYVLRLEYFANARENLGWMNLFRAWGRSGQFNADYEALRLTLSPQFRAFYETYVAQYRDHMAQRPVHHPWLRRPDDRGAGFFMDTGRTEPGAYRAGPRAGAGGVDDAKGRSGVDQGYEGSGGKAGDGGSSAPNA